MGINLKTGAFGGAAKGQIPGSAQVNIAKLMGKDLDPNGIGEIAAKIGHDVGQGVATPVNWAMASTVVEPSGGLKPKGHENTPYAYKGEEMFGIAAPTAG